MAETAEQTISPCPTCGQAVISFDYKHPPEELAPWAESTVVRRNVLTLKPCGHTLSGDQRVTVTVRGVPS